MKSTCIRSREDGGSHLLQVGPLGNDRTLSRQALVWAFIIRCFFRAFNTSFIVKVKVWLAVCAFDARSSIEIGVLLGAVRYVGVFFKIIVVDVLPLVFGLSSVYQIWSCLGIGLIWEVGLHTLVQVDAEDICITALSAFVCIKWEEAILFWALDTLITIKEGPFNGTLFAIFKLSSFFVVFNHLLRVSRWPIIVVKIGVKVIPLTAVVLGVVSFALGAIFALFGLVIEKHSILTVNAGLLYFKWFDFGAIYNVGCFSQLFYFFLDVGNSLSFGKNEFILCDC